MGVRRSTEDRIALPLNYNSKTGGSDLAAKKDLEESRERERQPFSLSCNFASVPSRPFPGRNPLLVVRLWRWLVGECFPSLSERAPWNFYGTVYDSITDLYKIIIISLDGKQRGDDL